MYKLYADNPRNQIEHMSFGGLWVGGIGGDDDGVHVSTAIIDGVFEAGEEGFEFTNSAAAGDTIRIRSTIVTSPISIRGRFPTRIFAAISLTPSASPWNRFRDFQPLSAWIKDPFGVVCMDFSFTDAFVILNYTITNISNHRIDELYTGLWADASVGNMNYTSIYQPGGGWTWYDNLTGFDQPYRLAYQYDVDGDDVFAQSHFGLRYLGSSAEQEGIQSHFDTWKWSTSSSLDYPGLCDPHQR
jgi:hypothetical protein